MSKLLRKHFTDKINLSPLGSYNEPVLEYPVQLVEQGYGSLK